MSENYFKAAHRRVTAYPRWLRIVIGMALLIGGVLGFLPVLGFWMFPLGLLVLSYDLAWVRRRCHRAARRPETRVH